MIENIIVVGDLHLSSIHNKTKHGQVKDFLFWLFNESQLNNENNKLLLLGDLVETMDDPSELLEIYIDLFLNESKFDSITILKGNHDENMNSSFTSALRPLHNVEVIEYFCEKNIANVKCLFLPYFDHTKTKSIPMHELYSNPKNMKNHVENSTPYDYVFHHVEDEQNHYSKKYCDLSWVNTNNWLCGHIHVENITKGGRILGAPIFNSLTEKNKIPYIAKIDVNTKKYALIEVPVFLSYMEVDYPSKLTVPKTKYALWTVNNSLNKNETLKYYQAEALKLGFEFHARRINSKRIVKDELLTGNELKSKESYTETFNRYSQDNKLDTEIHDICFDILKNRESK